MKEAALTWPAFISPAIRSRCPSIAFAAAAAPAAATPRVHPADVEARLARLVGEWSIQGLSASEFRQKCDWLDRGSFVVCVFDDKRDQSKGQVVFGYSKTQSRFVNIAFDSSGDSVHQFGFPVGRHDFVFTNEKLGPEAWVRFQTTYGLEEDGWRYTQYRSVAGREWQRTADFLYVPVAKSRGGRRSRR